MDTLASYRQIIQQVLTQHTRVPYTYGDVKPETVFDTVNDQYLVLTIGWDGEQRIHGTLIHVAMQDGKVWVQRDGTEEGIATALAAAGIPKEHIVLGFQPADVRPYTEFAVA